MPPWMTERGWLSTREVAEQFQRSQRTIQLLCQSGDLLAFGFQLAKDFQGRWRIRPTQPISQGELR